MRDLLPVAHVDLVAAGADETRRGLLGSGSFSLGGVLGVVSVEVRRSREGRLELTFPGGRAERRGAQSHGTPLSRDAHREIERQVLAELGRLGGAT